MEFPSSLNLIFIPYTMGARRQLWDFPEDLVQGMSLLYCVRR